MKKTSKGTLPEFDANDLVEAVEAFAAGREPFRVRTVTAPPKLKAISAREVRAIRQQLGVSQVEFAALLNVPTGTAISWENGSRKPTGAALRLLAVAKHHPKALLTA